MKAFFDKFKKGLDITRTSLTRNIKGLFTDVGEWSDDDYDELEAALIGSDLGVNYSTRLVEDIRERYQRGLIKTAEDIIRIAREDVREIMDKDVPPMKIAADGPTVFLMVGVNGSGKTTTSGKLGKLYSDEGKKVMFAACDTFRAAAVEQMKIWGERVGCDVISGKPGADAAAVAYDACKAAIARKVDILFIDTAGRQHTKKGLMDELAKIHRTIDRACPGARSVLESLSAP